MSVADGRFECKFDYPNLVGKKFNNLTITKFLGKGKKELMVEVFCDCSPDKRLIKQAYNVVSGHTKSCSLSCKLKSNFYILICPGCNQSVEVNVSRPRKFCSVPCKIQFNKNIPNHIKEERFWKCVDKTPGFGPWGDCWFWKSSLSGNDRGSLYFSGKAKTAPRISYEIHHGVILPPCMNLTEKNLVCHSCDIPRCVNPAHLWLGTDKDNAIDRNNKGRGYVVSVSKPKLDEHMVRQIRELTIQGEKTIDIAKKFNVNRKTIRSVLNGKSWRRVK
jgi:hypothetical protein